MCLGVRSYLQRLVEPHVLRVVPFLSTKDALHVCLETSAACRLLRQHVLLYITHKTNLYFYLSVPRIGIYLACLLCCVCADPGHLLSAVARRHGAKVPPDVLISYQLPRYTLRNRTCVGADLCVFVFRLCKYVHSPVFVTQERREEFG